MLPFFHFGSRTKSCSLLLTVNLLTMTTFMLHVNCHDIYISLFRPLLWSAVVPGLAIAGDIFRSLHGRLGHCLKRCGNQFFWLNLFDLASAFQNRWSNSNSRSSRVCDWYWGFQIHLAWNLKLGANQSTGRMIRIPNAIGLPQSNRKSAFPFPTLFTIMY